MEFRAPAVAGQQNSRALAYLTKDLQDQEGGRRQFDELVKVLGSAVDYYPDWHPILTAPNKGSSEPALSITEIKAYRGQDHTSEFVRGFVTCPYSEERADRIVEAVRQVPGLHAYRLPVALYSDDAFPVVVEALDIALEADGTIRSRDALVWFAQQMVQQAATAHVAETWWNIRGNILGGPHGSRSSLFVNQHTGVHMRKILDAMNNSGMFGPIKESSLEMLSPKKRATISENLIRAAVGSWDKGEESFEFELRGETCKASVKDTWGDGQELSIRVVIGEYDLFVQGFSHPLDNRITQIEPRGRRELAEKFL